MLGGLRSRRIGGQWRENEVLPKNLHSGRTALSSDVRSVCDRKNVFSLAVP